MDNKESCLDNKEFVHGADISKEDDCIIQCPLNNFSDSEDNLMQQSGTENQISPVSPPQKESSLEQANDSLGLCSGKSSTIATAGILVATKEFENANFELQDDSEENKKTFALKQSSNDSIQLEVLSSPAENTLVDVNESLRADNDVSIDGQTDHDASCAAVEPSVVEISEDLRPKEGDCSAKVQSCASESITDESQLRVEHGAPTSIEQPLNINSGSEFSRHEETHMPDEGPPAEDNIQLDCQSDQDKMAIACEFANAQMFEIPNDVKPQEAAFRAESKSNASADLTDERVADEALPSSAEDKLNESLEQVQVNDDSCKLIGVESADGVDTEYSEEPDSDKNKSLTGRLSLANEPAGLAEATAMNPEPQENDCHESKLTSVDKDTTQPSVTISNNDREEEMSLENVCNNADLGVGAELELMKRTVDQVSHLKKASGNHTVLFDISALSNARFAEQPLPPYQKSWQRRGNSECYVRLACHNNRWKDIKQRLSELCSPDVTYFHLEEVIIFCGCLDRNVHEFDVLRYFFNEDMDAREAQHFFKNFLPAIVKLAVSLPDLIKAPIPLLKHSQIMKLSLTQQQIASLLANAFFCTFPQREPFNRFPSINFYTLFSSGRHGSPCPRRLEKLRCFFHYMARIAKKVPTGVVTISRRKLKNSIDWSSRTEALPELLHVSSQGTIEDTDGGFLEADFANKYVGGGVLSHGFVQEEIRFSICPELIVTRLVTECLDDREALHVKGFERFSNYTGYASSCLWNGDHEDQRPIGLDRRRMSRLVAMDALHFSNWREQFTRVNIDRELHKALVAFGDVAKSASQKQRAAVATGNWGCGAFKGDVSLKFIVQLMACGVAGRNMAYFTFGDKQLQQRLLDMHKFLRDREVCVGGVYQAVISFTEHLDSSDHKGWQYNADSAPDLFQFLKQFVLHGPPTVRPAPEQSVSKSNRQREKANQEKQNEPLTVANRASQESSAEEAKQDNKLSTDHQLEQLQADQDTAGLALVKQNDKVPNDELLDQFQIDDESREELAKPSSDETPGAQASADGEWNQVKNKKRNRMRPNSASNKADDLSNAMSNLSLSAKQGHGNGRKRSGQSNSSNTGASANPAGCAQNTPPPEKKKAKKNQKKKRKR